MEDKKKRKEQKEKEKIKWRNEAKKENKTGIKV
jgi:hypothetical protein